jgi:WD40 repeat protein
LSDELRMMDERSARSAALLVPTSKIATLNGHTDNVECCAVFAEGRRALSGSSDNTLKVWDLDTNAVIATLNGHSGDVQCCSVFAGGTRALSGSRDNTLKVWNLETNAVIATLNGHSDTVNCCSVSIACTDEVFKVQNLQLVYSFLACGSSKHTPDNSGGKVESAGAGAGSYLEKKTAELLRQQHHHFVGC